MEGSKRWKNFDFGPKDTSKNDSSQEQQGSKVRSDTPFKKSRKTVTKFEVPKRQIVDFHKRLTPISVHELAVHPKKIQEVEGWLNTSMNSPHQKMKSSFLLISGPTGSGKTTTFYVVCKSLGISVSEWVNPIDQDYEIKRENQIDRFMEFLGDSKWSSLFENQDKKITLVKDFPNAVIHRPEQFYEILEQCSYKNGNPIVFICTESTNNNVNLVRSLFPDEILTKYNIAHISFNACATSLMKNAVKRALEVIKENGSLFKQPSSTAIEAIIASSMGDIRNAMNQLHLASLKGSGDVPVIQSCKELSGTKRRKLDKDVKLKGMSKDENLGLFHGLGRVLCPKRKQVGNSWRLCHDIEKLVDEFSIQPSMFVSFLFENYLKYFGNLDEACEAANVLSISAGLLDEWTGVHETLINALWISVLGLMVFNEHKTSRWNQIRAPVKSIKCYERTEETVGLNSTDYFYYDLITKSNKFHKFQIN